MEHFGDIYYINLDKRKDRLEEIQGELSKMDLSGVRFPAIHHRSGIVGCGYSHLAVLKEARSRNLKNVLILEDDFEFLVSKEEFQSHIEEFFSLNEPYDVLMLSYNIYEAKKVSSLLQRIYYSITASGYLVNSSMYDRIIELYEKNLPLLEKTGQHWIYANDQIWKTLQGDASNWYAFNTRIGRQRASHSDNSGKFANYGV